MRLECNWNVCDPTGTYTFCKRKTLQLFIYLYQRICHGLFVLPICLVSFVGFPDGILLKSISDRYRPDRNPVGPITARYRFKVLFCDFGCFRILFIYFYRVMKI